MSQDTENSDISIIGELSHHVAAHSKTSIVRCLVKIKNDGKIFDRFIKDGGIDILSKLLKCQNSKILDITLSILANAFLKSTVRDEIHPRKIATNVVWIIKNLTPGISLHCRACRLIGNMAESIVHAKALFNVGVISALNDVLNSKTNTQTLIMAIRAIRNIWTTMEQSQKEILDYGLIKSITTLLVSFKLKFQEDETLIKYKECAETCLKAIHAFVDTSDPRPGEQMKIKNNLCGFKCIVEYCKLNNRMAFQIVYQLSRIADHRPDLGSHGAIECIIAFLKSKQKDNLNSSFSGQVVMSLCFFSREAVNRRRIRDAGGLEVMLKLLETVHNEMHHVILLHALTEFVHNDESIAIMIKNGIVNVLVTRLKQMVFENRLKNCDINNINTSSRKRTADDMSSPNKIKICNQVKHNRLSSGRYSLDLYTSDWSPRCASSTCSSPSKTSPIPYPTSDDSKDEDDNYSLVCSDNEDRIDEENGTLYEEVDSLNSYVSSNIGKDDGGISMKSDKELTEIDSTTEMNEVNLTHTCTLILLTRLTLWNDPIQALAHPTTIKALTCYIEISKNYHASLILSKIIKNHVYFLPLLLQGFVFEAQLLENASGYLEKFSNMAESGGAFGELTRILLRGHESDKLMVAISIPFLLRSKDKLRQLLHDYGGLELIFNLLFDENHHLNENSVLSVCQLANGLGIIPDTIEELLSSNDISCDGNDILNNDKDKNNDGDKAKRKSTVTFELDDGGTVDVCRRLLCNKSEAFCAMLEGKFSEARQNRVRLREVSTEGFAVLCLTASGHLFNKNDNDNQEIEIESILDGVLLANKFLMVNEWRKLLETSMSQMYHGNLSRVWNWARLNSDRKFKICCVKYFLTSKISRDDRLGAFRDFAANENFKEFLEDIKDIVTEKLLIRQ